MVDQQCPLKWGDRVAHKLFGFGTVNGEPVAVQRGDLKLGLVPAGWAVPVEWDDKGRPASRIQHAVLEKVSSPDAKGVHYWHHQWKLLVETCLAARRDTDALLTASFRGEPPFSDAEFDRRLKSERCKLEELRQFLRDDAAGVHK